jgi:type VI secretion system Hcp family effector
MAESGGGIDAYLTFIGGRAGRGAAPVIEGETKDVVEKDWSSLQIQSYQLDFEMVAESTEETVTKAGDGVAHNPEFGPVTISKFVDQASPMLLQALHLAAQYDEVWICQRKAGAAQGQSGGYFWEIRLGTVAIKKLQWRASDSGYPVEDITLEYETITAYYRQQKRTGELIDTAIQTDEDLGQRAPAKRKRKRGDISDSQFEDILARVTRELKHRQAKAPALR